MPDLKRFESFLQDCFKRWWQPFWYDDFISLRLTSDLIVEDIKIDLEYMDNEDKMHKYYSVREVLSLDSELFPFIIKNNLFDIEGTKLEITYKNNDKTNIEYTYSDNHPKFYAYHFANVEWGYLIEDFLGLIKN